MNEPLTLESIVKPIDDVLYQTVGDETVLLSLKTGMYYGLDTVGNRIWELLNDSGHLQVIFAKMADEYDVAPDTLERDIIRLVGDLLSKELVEVTT